MFREHSPVCFDTIEFDNERIHEINKRKFIVQNWICLWGAFKVILKKSVRDHSSITLACLRWGGSELKCWQKSWYVPGAIIGDGSFPESFMLLSIFLSMAEQFNLSVFGLCGNTV